MVDPTIIDPQPVPPAATAPMVDHNVPPIASFTHSCLELTCTFDPAGSHDPDGTITLFEWVFSDGTRDTGPIVQHAFPGPGGHSATLTVTDDDSATAQNSKAFTLVPATGQMPANLPPTASFTATCQELSCRFDATGSSDPDGSITRFDWTFGDGTAASGSQVEHSYADRRRRTVTLTVTDDDTAGASQSQDVHGTVLNAGNFVAGHRGVVSPGAPENTIPALVRAAAGGYVVELDIRFTSDLVPVVFHDTTTTRTLTCPGLTISGLTLADLRARCDVQGMPAGSEVPTWSEAADAIAAQASAAVTIAEVKVMPTDPMAQDVLAPLIGHPALLSRTVIESFNSLTLAKMRDAATSRGISLRTAPVFSDRLYTAAELEDFGAGGTVAVLPYAPLVTREWVQQMHEAGIAVWPWTPNDPAQWQALRDLGADVLVTDSAAAAWSAMAQFEPVRVSPAGLAIGFTLPAAPLGATEWAITVDGIEELIPSAGTSYSRPVSPAGSTHNWAVAALNPDGRSASRSGTVTLG